MQGDGVMCKYLSKNQTKYFLLVHFCSYRHSLIAVFGQKVKDMILEFTQSVELITREAVQK